MVIIFFGHQGEQVINFRKVKGHIMLMNCASCLYWTPPPCPRFSSTVTVSPADPTFISSSYVPSEEKVYFFFSEVGREYDFIDKLTVSRVAQVCTVRQMCAIFHRNVRVCFRESMRIGAVFVLNIPESVAVCGELCLIIDKLACVALIMEQNFPSACLWLRFCFCYNQLFQGVCVCVC